MTRKLDEKMLSGFSRELRGYLTNIRENIERLNDQHDALEQATQGLTTITGALQMIGFSGLSHLASYLRDTLDASFGNQDQPDTVFQAWCGSTIVQLERNLESILAGQLSEDTFVAEIEHSLNRYKEAGAITETSATRSTDTPTEVQNVGDRTEGATLYVALDDDEHDTVADEESEPESLDFIEESLVQPTVAETTPASSLPSTLDEGPQEIAIDDSPTQAQHVVPDVQKTPSLLEAPLADEPTISKMVEGGFEDDTIDHTDEADSLGVGEGESVPVTDTPALEDVDLIESTTDETNEPITHADSTLSDEGEQVDAFMAGPDEPTLIEDRDGFGILLPEETATNVVDQSTTIRDAHSQGELDTGLTDILPTDTIEFVLPETPEEASHYTATEQRTTGTELEKVSDQSPDVEIPLSSETLDDIDRVQERDLQPKIIDVSADEPTLVDVNLIPELPQAALPTAEELDASVPEFATLDEPTSIDDTPTFSKPVAGDNIQDVHADSSVHTADAETIESPRPESSGPATDAGSTEATLSSDTMSTHDADYEPYLELPLTQAQDELSTTHIDGQAGESVTPVASCEDTAADDNTDMSVLRDGAPETGTGELTNAETGGSCGSEYEAAHASDEFENTCIEDDTSELCPITPEANAPESFVVPFHSEEEAPSISEVIDVDDMEPEAVSTSLENGADEIVEHTFEEKERIDIPDETDSQDLAIDLLMSDPDDDDETVDQSTSQGVACESQESSDENAIQAAVEDEEDSGDWLDADDSLPELLFDPDESLEEEHPGEESSVVAPSQIPAGPPPVEDVAESSIPPDTTGQELNALVEAIDNEVQEAYGQAEVSPDERRAQGELRSFERYLLCTLAGSRYAVGVPHVLEISRVPQMTAVPNVPEWVSGVINLRGEIISVIDLRTFLGLEKSHQPDQSRLLIVKTHDDTLTTSLIVDQINGFARLPENMIQEMTMSFQSNLDPYLVGISEYEDHVLAVFDLERFLQSSEICQFDVA